MRGRSLGEGSLLLAALTLLCVCYTTRAQLNVTCNSAAAGSFYDLNATDINFKPVQFSQYAGQVTLVINTASFCGHTVTNYQELNQIVGQLGAGFTVLAFPCAQFYNQEPGKEAEIPNILKYVRPGGGYVPNFFLSSKILVNGQGTHPVYQFLKGRCGPTNAVIGDLPYISWTPISYNDVTWNFEKFLINQKGQVIRRYDPNTDPVRIVADIKNLLNAY